MSEYAEKFDFLTLPEISDYLGIPLSSLYRARAEGEMPPGFTLSGRTRWRRAVIDQWVEANEAADSFSAQTAPMEGTS